MGWLPVVSGDSCGKSGADFADAADGNEGSEGEGDGLLAMPQARRTGGCSRRFRHTWQPPLRAHAFSTFYNDTGVQGLVAWIKDEAVCECRAMDICLPAAVSVKQDAQSALQS